jgi:hypothetical protein
MCQIEPPLGIIREGAGTYKVDKGAELLVEGDWEEAPHGVLLVANDVEGIGFPRRVPGFLSVNSDRAGLAWFGAPASESLFDRKLLLWGWLIIILRLSESAPRLGYTCH